MSIRRILVGVDFTEHTEAVIAHARNLALRHGAEVVLTHVMYVGFDVPLGHLSSPGYSDFLVSQQEQIREELGRLRVHFGEEVAVSVQILEGKPAPALSVAADEFDVDLVILGSHSRTGFERFLVGSVAERTVRFADRTVMVAKDLPRDSRGYHRILVPTDFSRAAEQALATSFEFAAPDAHIELLHCWAMPVYQASLEPTGMGMAVLGSEIEQEVAFQGQRLLDAFKDCGFKLTFEQIQNKATYGIQERLESKSFDLVVMGHYGRSGFGRWLIGSVAEFTVRHAPCSVVVVKTAGEEDWD